MRIFGFLLLFLFSSSINAQGIEFFHGEWKAALEEAQKEDKVVFVDCYTSWCGPCKRMAKNVFTQDKVGDFFNKSFVNLKLNMEEPDGRSFGSKFPVSAYPTLFFLTPDGEIIKKGTGGQQAEGLIALGKAAILGYDKTEDYAIKYEKGDRDYELIYNYVKELNKVGKPSLKISNDYLRSNPEITAEQKAAFLLEAVTEADSKIFDALIESKSTAIKVGTEEKFIATVKKAAFKTIEKSGEYDFEDLFKESIEKYKSAKLKNDKRFEQEAYLHYYKLRGDYIKWKEKNDKYLKKYGKKDPSVYSTQLATIQNSFKHADNSKDYACEICKDLVKKDDSVANYSSYIKLLMECKKNEEAKSITEEAIKRAQSRNEDITQFERILKYLERI